METTKKAVVVKPSITEMRDRIVQAVDAMFGERTFTDYKGKTVTVYGLPRTTADCDGEVPEGFTANDSGWLSMLFSTCQAQVSISVSRFNPLPAMQHATKLARVEADVTKLGDDELLALKARIDGMLTAKTTPKS